MHLGGAAPPSRDVANDGGATVGPVFSVACRGCVHPHRCQTGQTGQAGIQYTRGVRLLLLLLLISLLFPSQQAWATATDRCSGVCSGQSCNPAVHCSGSVPDLQDDDHRATAEKCVQDCSMCPLNCCALPPAVGRSPRMLDRAVMQRVVASSAPAPFEERPERPQWMARSTRA